VTGGGGGAEAREGPPETGSMTSGSREHDPREQRAQDLGAGSTKMSKEVGAGSKGVGARN
jgi:hypothetical protein